MTLNMDPNLLLSLVNTKLRNDYDSLKTLAERENLDLQALKDKLKIIGYVYDSKAHQFKASQ